MEAAVSVFDRDSLLEMPLATFFESVLQFVDPNSKKGSLVAEDILLAEGACKTWLKGVVTLSTSGVSNDDVHECFWVALEKADKIANSDLQGRLISFLVTDLIFRCEYWVFEGVNRIRDRFWKLQALREILIALRESFDQAEELTISEGTVALLSEISQLILEGRIVEAEERSAAIENEALQFYVQLVLVNAYLIVSGEGEGDFWSLACKVHESRYSQGEVYPIVVGHFLSKEEDEKARRIADRVVDENIRAMLYAEVIFVLTQKLQDAERAWELSSRMADVAFQSMIQEKLLLLCIRFGFCEFARGRLNQIKLPLTKKKIQKALAK